jgi:hypothetical protein
MSNFFRASTMKGCWILSKTSCDFVFDFVYVLCYVYWFAYVESFWHSWNETNLIRVYDFFNVSNSICKYFIDNFCIYVHWGNWPIIVFVMSLSRHYFMPSLLLKFLKRNLLLFWWVFLYRWLSASLFQLSIFFLCSVYLMF